MGDPIYKDLTVDALYDLSHTLAAPLLAAATYPWEVLDELGEFICALGSNLPAEEYDIPRPRCGYTKPRGCSTRPISAKM